jgi:hypothetical protein
VKLAHGKTCMKVSFKGRSKNSDHEGTLRKIDQRDKRKTDEWSHKGQEKKI